MDMVHLEEQEDKLEFVRQAAKKFSENPKGMTYTRGNIEPGALFAMRFGLGDDCVVVFRIDENFPVENFQNIIDVS